VEISIGMAIIIMIAMLGSFVIGYSEGRNG